MYFSISGRWLLTNLSASRMAMVRLSPIANSPAQNPPQDVIAAVVSGHDAIGRFLEARVDVIYLVGGALDSGIFTRQLRLLDPDITVLGSDTLVSRVFLEAAAHAAEGVAFTFPPDAAGLPFSEPAQHAIRELGLEPVGYSLLAYAATEVWIAGVRRAGSFTAGEVAAAIREAPIDTVLGAVHFDRKGDIGTSYPAFSWYRWEGGHRVPDF